MVTGERARAAVGVDGGRAVTWAVDRSARVGARHRCQQQQQTQHVRAVTDHPSVLFSTQDGQIYTRDAIFRLRPNSSPISTNINSKISSNPNV